MRRCGTLRRRIRSSQGVLPKTYQIFDSTLLKNLLKKVSEIPATAEGDTFGRIYDEDFKAQLETLNEELETLNAQARDLEQTIARNVAEILET
jgi:hypothetical protein